MKIRFLFIFILFPFLVLAQKKPLDHSVYDGWQSIGERLISNDGQWVVYSVNPQEGDNDLVIQSFDGDYKMVIPRGYSAVITADSRFIICRIRPTYKETRTARIAKKKPEEMPKDSLAVFEAGKENNWKVARVKSFKSPEKASGWVAYQLEKSETASKAGNVTPASNNKTYDSLRHVIDSLENMVKGEPDRKKKKNKDDSPFATVDGFDETNTPFATDPEPGNLVLRNLNTGEEKLFADVRDYLFNKLGGKLLFHSSKKVNDSVTRNSIVLYDVVSGKIDTISRGGNDFKNLAISDDGNQLAFEAERDAAPKTLQKFYKLWYYKEGMDSAQLLADRYTVGMRLGFTVSENAKLEFSKSGKRLFFGTASIAPPADTALVEFDHPKMDIWHYKDDFLQTVQLVRLQEELTRSYLAVAEPGSGMIRQLASPEIPEVIRTAGGDGEKFVGISDVGKRIESQWTGNTLDDIYSIDVNTGEAKLVKKDLFGGAIESSTGKYIAWYDRHAKNYFVWDGTAIRNVSEKIKFPLGVVESEVPEDPGPYGDMGWSEGDSALFVYDKYDIWRLDPRGAKSPVAFSNGIGRKTHTIFRYVQLDPEKYFFNQRDTILLRSFNDVTKTNELAFARIDSNAITSIDNPRINGSFSIGLIRQAENHPVSLIYTKENFIHSPDLYAVQLSMPGSAKGKDSLSATEKQLSFINPQQASYNWGTAQLFNWKAYNGKDATGIVYLPENFDPKKKYPMICYFYETLSDNLNRYIAPAPIRSAINVSFFVSRGYVIFLPDIHYGVGHPGKDAYDYVVSGARALVKKGYVDSTRMAIQGHSWGGYQVAQLVTMTKLFKAAWAGAPVANMTSAYGGIRWESGLNRQFQYEKSQSRIGATLWEKPQLFIENSPLFHLDKVTTPLVIMSNDGDGAVPWYQGIELFTGMRRLGKKVWLFNYNGQGHGLTQRQDMRDYEIRMQQFFDWILKDEAPSRWIIEGLPAVKKGKDWALDPE